MGANTAAAQREVVADAYVGSATYASLHTATPGTTGASEAAVTRVAVTWATGDAADGVNQGTAALTVPAGVTVTHAGLWSAASGGVYRDGGPLPASYTGPGTYTVTFTVTAS